MEVVVAEELEVHRRPVGTGPPPSSFSHPYFITSQWPLQVDPQKYPAVFPAPGVTAAGVGPEACLLGVDAEEPESSTPGRGRLLVRQRVVGRKPSPPYRGGGRRGLRAALVATLGRVRLLCLDAPERRASLQRSGRHLSGDDRENAVRPEPECPGAWELPPLDQGQERLTTGRSGLRAGPKT